ncbi:hypothetical protein LMH87_009663 [Akanthomyces muscarius]|uniref:Acyltransferase 3 domain-containing protein n=2 Tax=Akanthomyces muscarius TaxID=2231603 RepID=A0A9W8UMG4_AKAMU|nr:hypothetical protein LMH87_009663 [Akanthomyces muscarius]KAJ4153161.1 hypothetical protein LMH87_009663 [Akanthomyces muscarius]
MMGLADSLREREWLKRPKTTFRILLSAFLFALLPSFIQRRLRPGEFKPRRISPTSWLDGLRGVAAFTVYVNHYTAMNFVRFQRSYGDHELVEWSSPVQLPFVRVIFCGLPMVHIFFVISGFALSYKPLRLMRARKYHELHEALASSIFRRGFRLFLPVMASTLFVMTVCYVGITSGALPTLAENIWDWWKAIGQITDSWSWDVLWYPRYDVHLWTIGIEFSHSMLLFVILMGTSRMRTPLRLGFLFVFVYYCMRYGRWGPAEFTAGMIIAEFTLIQNEKNAMVEGPLLPRSNSASVKRIILVIFLLVNLMFALFVAGWPNGDVTVQTGFSFLYRNTPDPFWSIGGNVLIFPWYALGAVQIVMAAHQIQPIQNLFVTPIAQYLGDISFSLYLMHGPMQGILEWRILPTAWALVDGTKTAGMWQTTIAWAIGFAMLAPFTLWISDIFWRFVDVPSVRFARWLESLCIHQEPASGYEPAVGYPHKIKDEGSHQAAA